MIENWPDTDGVVHQAQSVRYNIRENAIVGEILCTPGRLAISPGSIEVLRRPVTCLVCLTSPDLVPDAALPASGLQR